MIGDERFEEIRIAYNAMLQCDGTLADYMKLENRVLGSVGELLDTLEDTQALAERMRIERDSARIELFCDNEAWRLLDREQAENERLRQALAKAERHALRSHTSGQDFDGRWHSVRFCAGCGELFRDVGGEWVGKHGDRCVFSEPVRLMSLYAARFAVVEFSGWCDG